MFTIGTFANSYIINYLILLKYFSSRYLVYFIIFNYHNFSYRKKLREYNKSEWKKNFEPSKFWR